MVKASLFFTVIVALLVAEAYADMYLHNPRGSNDRNCEKNENRNNGNRLFDSQNNDKGGYPCPRAVGAENVITPTMYYYSGSKLSISWTNQHACGSNPIQKCDIILQYMCSETKNDKATNQPISMYDPTHPLYDLVNAGVRDGTPQSPADSATDTMQTASEVYSPEYGYHETYNYYQACATRTRNEGVWIADQNLQVNGPATTTRQNPNADRHGWECAEERDYYPYFAPSPWKDIAVLTSDATKCSIYKKFSQNQNDKYWCRSTPNPATPGLPTSFLKWNTESACVANGGAWVRVPSWNLPAPECTEAPWSRDNHLGDSMNNFNAHYNWTIPTTSSELTPSCVFRIRYNISGILNWYTDARSNAPNSPVTQDPYFMMANNLNLSMAVNTDQYGRTFQDRSYVFNIKNRGNNMAAGTIWNLNIRGKRGNIVQTFPAVEYDFVPTFLHVQQDDYVHFQWAGSDYNVDRQPNNAEGGPLDADGGHRADRSNVVPITRRHQVSATGLDSSWFGTMSREQMISLAYINQDMKLCQSLSQLQADFPGNTDEQETATGNCMKLNAAPNPYFDLGPVKMTSLGTYTYMSTRNNNFSNRSQRAAIYVNPKLTAAEKAGIAVGTVAGAAMFATAGGYFYAKKHPNGRVAGVMSKIPLLGH